MLIKISLLWKLVYQINSLRNKTCDKVARIITRTPQTNALIAQDRGHRPYLQAWQLLCTPKTFLGNS